MRHVDAARSPTEARLLAAALGAGRGGAGGGMRSYRDRESQSRGSGYTSDMTRELPPPALIGKREASRILGITGPMFDKLRRAGEIAPW